LKARGGTSAKISATSLRDSPGPGIKRADLLTKIRPDAIATERRARKAGRALVSRARGVSAFGFDPSRDTPSSIEPLAGRSRSRVPPAAMLTLLRLLC
jgi:hypothetical protein